MLSRTFPPYVALSEYFIIYEKKTRAESVSEDRAAADKQDFVAFRTLELFYGKNVKEFVFLEKRMGAGIRA